MQNEQIEEMLNRVTNNKYQFKFKSVNLAEKCEIELLYSDGTILSPEDKVKCRLAISEYLDGYPFSVKFIKNYVSETIVKDFVENYLHKNFASIVFKAHDVVYDKIFVVTLDIAEEQEQYVVSQKILIKIIEALKAKYEAEFKIVANYLPNMIDFDSVEEKEIEIKKPKTIVCSNKQIVIGEEIAGDAKYIRDNKSATDSIILCGFITHYERRFTKPKIAEGENAEEKIEYYNNPDVPLEERIAAGQKVYYKFTLEDFTGLIDGVIYPKKDEVSKLEEIKENDAVIMEGKIEVNDYGVTFRPKSISKCSLPEKWEEEIELKQEKAYYEFIKPQKMVYTDQIDIFSNLEIRQVAPFLKDKEIVVFDFETTGLHPYEGDKIVEIGAVKVIDGAIVESFRTLVNPERRIPAESTAVHHIKDSDVVDAPKAEQALQDFYKFTRGCLLVGYNVGFDYSFLSKQGKECGYNFDNKVFDCYRLAQKYVKKIKNYKLITVAKELGVTLDNAHSALYDTIATAEVMIKLAWKIEPNDDFSPI